MLSLEMITRLSFLSYNPIVSTRERQEGKARSNRPGLRDLLVHPGDFRRTGSLDRCHDESGPEWDSLASHDGKASRLLYSFVLKQSCFQLARAPGVLKVLLSGSDSSFRASAWRVLLQSFLCAGLSLLAVKCCEPMHLFASRAALRSQAEAPA